MPAPEGSSEYPTPVGPRPSYVGRAVAAALATHGSSDDLRQLVCGYARDLRRAGLPPEQALVRVKQVVGPHLPVVRLPPEHGEPQSDLGRSVVEWFVAEYYRAD